MLLVSKILPPTSLVLPLIAKYLLFTFVMNCISILCTVVIINWNFRSPRTHRMPTWVRRLFLHYLPIVLFIRRPRRTRLTRMLHMPELDPTKAGETTARSTSGQSRPGKQPSSKTVRPTPNGSTASPTEDRDSVVGDLEPNQPRPPLASTAASHSLLRSASGEAACSAACSAASTAANTIRPTLEYLELDEMPANTTFQLLQPTLTVGNRNPLYGPTPHSLHATFSINNCNRQQSAIQTAMQFLPSHPYTGVGNNPLGAGEHQIAATTASNGNPLEPHLSTGQLLGTPLLLTSPLDGSGENDSVVAFNSATLPSVHHLQRSATLHYPVRHPVRHFHHQPPQPQHIHHQPASTHLHHHFHSSHQHPVISVQHSLPESVSQIAPPLVNGSAKNGSAAKPTTGNGFYLSAAAYRATEAIEFIAQHLRNEDEYIQVG